MKDLNVSPDTIKLLEDNIGRTLFVINHSEIFFDPPPRVMEIKTKINKWDLLLSHFSRVRLCATPETAAHQAFPFLGFSRQEHWSGLPFPSPMHESEKWKWGRSVVSNPQRPHGLQPTRLLRPWDFPGKSTGVGCHCLLLNGKKLGKRIGICITESLRCTPETNPTYSNIKLKNKLTVGYDLICFSKNNFWSIECKLGWREAREVEEPVRKWLWLSRQTTMVALPKVRRKDRERLGL